MFFFNSQIAVAGKIVKFKGNTLVVIEIDGLKKFLTQYDENGKKLKQINVSYVPVSLCFNGDYLFVSKKTGGIVLYDKTIKKIKEIKSIPLYSITCNKNSVLAVGRTLKILKYQIPLMKLVSTGKEHDSWISKILFLKNQKDFISFGWDHKSILWKNSKKIIYKQRKPLIDGIFINNEVNLVTLADDFRMILFDKKGKAKEFFKISNCTTLGTSGKVIFVGNKSGKIYKFKIIGSKLRRGKYKQIFKNEAIRGIKYIKGNKWGILGNKFVVKTF
jgi:WD40 repeat protein